MRRATGSDVAALTRLEAEAFGDGAWSAAALGRLVDAAARPGDTEQTHVWVGEHDGEVAVYAVFQRVLDEAELLRVGVRPRARRRGLAQRLLREALRRLGARGVVTCHLEVAAGNAAAFGLYGGLGFRQVGLRRAYYRDGTDALLLCCELGPDASRGDGSSPSRT